LHVYRLGLAFHALYYATLLVLRERSPDYAVHLGVMLGVTWGIFWAGANTFNFDVTSQGKREFYFGLLQAVNGVFRLISPLVGGLIIRFSSTILRGYHTVFALAILLYVACFALSFRMPPDNVRRRFRLRRALFPGKDQRDWRLIMLASMTTGGMFSIFAFLLGLLMYMETANELHVGAFASVQGLAGVMVALMLGRLIVPANRKRPMQWGVILLVAAGALIFFRLSVTTLVVFGLLRAMAGPLFGIPSFSLRLDTIARSAEEPAQRIEYLCAWEVPLAIGRVLMMLVIMGLYGWLSGNELGLRIALFVLCSMRAVTYLILSRTDALREGA
jgi:YQGE family putative transporter